MLNQNVKTKMYILFIKLLMLMKHMLIFFFFLEHHNTSCPIIKVVHTNEKPNKPQLIIIMVIFKCYFSGELIARSYKKQNKTKQQQRCEHRIRKNKQIKSTVHDGNKKMK